MVDPITEICRKNSRCRSADGSAPVVAPQVTTTPPGRTAFIECAQVAAPTDSNTPSTRSGSRAPESKTWAAPSRSARSRPSSVRAVTHTRRPAAAPSWISAVATPPVAPCTSIVEPGVRPDLVKIIR